MSYYRIVIKDWDCELYSGGHWAESLSSARRYGLFLAKLLYGDQYTDISVGENK